MDNWIPVKILPPYELEVILLSIGNNAINGFFHATSNNFCHKDKVSNKLITIKNVTHWQPLPAAPGTPSTPTLQEQLATANETIAHYVANEYFLQKETKEWEEEAGRLDEQLATVEADKERLRKALERIEPQLVLLAMDVDRLSKDTKAAYNVNAALYIASECHTLISSTTPPTVSLLPVGSVAVPVEELRHWEQQLIIATNSPFATTPTYEVLESIQSYISTTNK